MLRVIGDESFRSSDSLVRGLGERGMRYFNVATYDSERRGELEPGDVTTTRGDCTVSKAPRTVAARSSSEIGKRLSMAL